MVLGILYESFIHPAHDPDGSPVRGRGRSRDADALPHGAVDLRLRRHHHARGPGEEERHHDGGLRDRGAAQGGKSPADAIFEACLVRFRPIMMTTMAALMGTLPIAMGFGGGSGVAPAPRPRRRRRARLLADPDALRHAGLLHPPGSPAAAAGAPPRKRHRHPRGVRGGRAGGDTRREDSSGHRAALYDPVGLDREGGLSGFSPSATSSRSVRTAACSSAAWRLSGSRSD